MFDTATIAAAEALAACLKIELVVPIAVAEVDSGGKVPPTVNGRQEPLMRFAGHYSDKR